jgi:DNA-binding CsgD family transcriptional regulator/tetratricopeptide (TPR) repeat protein
MQLLERDEILAELREQLRLALSGTGSIVCIEGEAGIGKTSLLRAFGAHTAATVPVWWGACDALQTPRPLGPLLDIAAQSPDPHLREALADATDRTRVFQAFVDWLTRHPALVLLEDLHWADDATLDLVRFVTRRISSTRSLVVGTFRSDEVGPSHPLRLALGDLASNRLQRIAPQPLSARAVAQLAAGTGLDPLQLHRVTGGNPFFVTEAVAAGSLEISSTVRDAVLARASRLRPSARVILDAVAVAGPRVEPWLLDKLLVAESIAIDECLAAGMLNSTGGAYGFRHELARQAILQTLTPTRTTSLHRLALQALEMPGAPSADLARLAHHAEGATQADSVLRYAPGAAREAAENSAHAQAMQQYARALRFVAPKSKDRAALLDDYSLECQLCSHIDEALSARVEAAALWRTFGDAGREAVSLARLATMLVLAGRNAAAEARLQEALDLVRSAPDSGAAMTTRRWSAYMRMLDRDCDDAISEAGLAMAVAERLGDAEATVQCLNIIGASLIVSDRIDEGIRHLERSKALAEQRGLHLWVVNALSNLGSGLGEAHRFELAGRYLERAIQSSIERDIDSTCLYATSWLALVQMYQGQWVESAATANAVIADKRSPPIAQIMALIALGRVRARRGDPGVWEALDAAQKLTGAATTLQRLAPVQCARAEAAFLAGTLLSLTNDLVSTVELARLKRHGWFLSELELWGSLGGLSPDEDLGVPGSHLPYALERRNQWREAADAWRALGCPYESARALAGGDEAAKREALAIFESLGAAPMAARVRQALHSAGVRNLPRGPRATTRENPAGMTGKEIVVLQLLVQGLRNKEIADKLHRSPRTIDHHVAAVFEKLGAANRAEAVSAAFRLGLVKDSG